MIEFDELPPQLQKLVLYWAEPENWGKKLIDVCSELNLNYGAIRKEIHKVGTLDFYELKARLVDRALVKHHDEILKALRKKAEEGNTRAIELYLKATQRLVDRLEVKADINLQVSEKLLDAKKRLKELEKAERKAKKQSGTKD